MQISIIIPVYNAGEYLEEAVESALGQEETGEVILAEDNSEDESLGICRSLEKRYEKVSLFGHPDGKNYGAGATRNLALRNASCDYIAFLDADDFFLPERFANVKRIINNDSTIDGVYEAVGTSFEDEKSRNRWTNNGNNDLTTLKRPVKPKALFDTLIAGRSGFFHGNGLTIKRKCIEKVGFFNEELRISQDTHMWIKLAATCKLAPGNLNRPVAMRRLHSGNRISKVSDEQHFANRKVLWNSLVEWANEIGLERRKKALLEFMAFFHDTMNPSDYKKIYAAKNYFKALTNYTSTKHLKDSVSIWKTLIITQLNRI